MREIGKGEENKDVCGVFRFSGFFEWDYVKGGRSENICVVGGELCE